MVAVKACAWCSQPVDPKRPYASRADGEVWHVDCFLKHLQHKDELAGNRRDHSFPFPSSMFCPKCLGPMIRDVRIEQAEDGSSLIQVEEFECAAGCDTLPPEPQERV